MSLFDRAAILKFHQDRIDEFGGGSVKALGWRDFPLRVCRQLTPNAVLVADYLPDDFTVYLYAR